MKSFKKWLIHKLGGYTEEQRINHAITYNTVKLETLKVAYQIRTSFIDWERYDEAIKEELAISIGKKLYKDNLIHFYVNTNNFGDKVVYGEIKIPIEEHQNEYR